ncbi:MupG family TIM beta-alpha barrel fold protein [Brochothrix campestris]|uniref:Outer surface protein n=1 Tax=Brochothrix campestris FSL F6-1037 TaxID=1265861 RepID=W7CPL6_9LIST|nr:MupG family TIM beta-alpha barrel fold protein [Brochothrix campestris]EUJ41589.1 hypothetical protein BCAMP_03370 [Brochothrix campestris FSL F6-1037]
MLGFLISLTEQTVAENKRLIERMAQTGSRYAFTSLQMPEEKPADLQAVLLEIGACLKAHQVQWIADVSPMTFEQFTLNRLKAFGFTGLRIDDGISMADIAAMTEEWQIILNASTLTAADMNDLMNNHAHMNRLAAWYNYYPRPETGLEREAFIKHTAFIKSYAIETGAFIHGDGKQRGPIYAGLPTLEEHRDVHPLAQYLDLRDCGIDTVLVGDLSLQSATMAQFERWFTDQLLLLHVDNQSDFAWLDDVFHVRRDVARDVIRAADSRVRLAQRYHPIAAEQTNERLRGCITIDNAAYLRYEGEVQIMLTDLQADSRVNVLGQVITGEHSLLRFLNRPGTAFAFSAVK